MKLKNQKIKSSIFARNIKPYKKIRNKKVSEKKFSIKEEILGLKKGMNSQKEDIADLKKGMNSQQKDISELKKGMNSQQKDISELKKSMNSQQKDIADLKKGMNIQKEDIADLKKSMSYLTVVVDQIREDFKDFKSELVLVKKKGEATFEEVGKLRVEMTEVKEEINELKSLLIKKADIKDLELLDIRVVKIEEYIKK